MTQASAEGIDFGVGTFPTYHSTNIFLAAYEPDAGSPQWAKQIPAILGVDVRGIALDSQGRVVVSGIYGGSIQIDDSLLVTAVPEDPNDGRSIRRLVRRAVAARHDAAGHRGWRRSDRGLDQHRAEQHPRPGDEPVRRRRVLHAAHRDRQWQLPTRARLHPAPASLARRPPTRRSRSARRPSPASRPIRSATNRARRSRSRSPTRSLR